MMDRDQDWSVERVQQLIDDGVEERLDLEYKRAAAIDRSDKAKNVLAKYVSAFANAAGGTLIIGVAEFDDKKREHLPEKLDPVDRTEVSKEWIEQVINGSIRPKVQGISIHPLTVDRESNTGMYVVEVPQGDTAHQARDKRYYRRFNFEVLMMDDHEIRDVMNRTQHPRIDLHFAFSRHTSVFRHDNMTPELFTTVCNTGTSFARFVHCRIYLPVTVWSGSPGKGVVRRDFDGEAYTLWEVDNRHLFFDAEGVLTFGEYVPVLPGLSFRHTNVLDKSLSPQSLASSTAKLIWFSHADNAPARRGEVWFKDIRWIHEYDSPGPEHDIKPGEVLEEGNVECLHQGNVSTHEKERAWRAKCRHCQREATGDSKESALVLLVSETHRQKYEWKDGYGHNWTTTGTVGFFPFGPVEAPLGSR